MPDHQTLIVVGIALFVILTTTITFLVKIWPVMRKLVNLVNDLGGEPARPGVPARPGIMERVARVEKYAKDADFHSKPNHGSSAYDALMREITTLSQRIDGTVEQMSDSQEDRRRIWTVLSQITQHASSPEHSETTTSHRGLRPPTGQ